MSIKEELKDLAYEVLAFVLTGIAVIALMVYTDLSKWPVIVIGTGLGVGSVVLIRIARKKR